MCGHGILNFHWNSLSQSVVAYEWNQDDLDVWLKMQIPSFFLRSSESEPLGMHWEQVPQEVIMHPKKSFKTNYAEKPN